jgi:hypothetical protein
MSQCHFVSIAIGRIKVASVHTKHGSHERQGKENNRYNREEHDRATLGDAFICSFQSMLSLDDARLLLFEAEEVFELHSELVKSSVKLGP